MEWFAAFSVGFGVGCVVAFAVTVVSMLILIGIHREMLSNDLMDSVKDQVRRTISAIEDDIVIQRRLREARDNGEEEPSPDDPREVGDYGDQDPADWWKRQG